MRVQAPTPLLSVVIGTYERKPYLKATLESVRKELDGIPHEIFVVDGGSGDGTPDWLSRQGDVITIVQHNRGEWRGCPLPRRSWGYFMNLAFKATQGPLVCMLSDDCLVIPGAIRNGLETYERHVAKGERVGGVAFYWRNWPTDDTYRVGLTFGDRMFVNHGLYSRAALEAVGYVDEEAFSFYHADSDLGLRMWEAGYVCVDSPESFVEHYLDANWAVRTSNYERQREDESTYRQRWGHLGEPQTDWRERSWCDAADTARCYWGRRRTNRHYRRLALATSIVRMRRLAVLGDVRRRFLSR